jgi:hypothetical protein
MIGWILLFWGLIVACIIGCVVSDIMIQRAEAREAQERREFRKFLADLDAMCEDDD